MKAAAESRASRTIAIARCKSYETSLTELLQAPPCLILANPHFLFPESQAFLHSPPPGLPDYPSPSSRLSSTAPYCNNSYFNATTSPPLLQRSPSSPPFLAISFDTCLQRCNSSPSPFRCISTATTLLCPFSQLCRAIPLADASANSPRSRQKASNKRNFLN